MSKELHDQIAKELSFKTKGRLEKEIITLNAIVHKLQQELMFWLPNVPAEESEFSKRAAAAAYMLIGYQGPDEEGAEELGWIVKAKKNRMGGSPCISQGSATATEAMGDPSRQLERELAIANKLKPCPIADGYKLVEELAQAKAALKECIAHADEMNKELVSIRDLDGYYFSYVTKVLYNYRAWRAGRE